MFHLNRPLFLGSLALVAAAILNAQAGRTPPGGGGSTMPTNPTSPTQPNIGNTNSPFPGTQPNTFPDNSIDRPLFLSGKVVMEDGTPPPESVVVHLTCNTNPRPIAYTDSKGYFNANLRDKLNNGVMADASDPYSGGGGRSDPWANNTNPRLRNGPGMGDLMGCRVEANLAGFRSEGVDLGARRSLDDPNIGTLILHRLANVEGLTISATSAMAPKDAKKAFEKGRSDEQKQKWDDAQKEFSKAVEIYPKYAAAWFELGNVQQKHQDAEGARKSYAQSLAADSKFVSPYLQLANMAAAEQKWQDVADDTDRLLHLNPVDFPQAWMFNAVANYNLQKFEVAEKSAREGLSHDPAHHFPTNSHLLGVLLAQKKDYAGSVQNLRDYLHYAPNATDANEVKKQLTEMEGLLGPEAQKH